MVDLRKKGSAPGLELLKQGQQGLFEHGKKLLDQAQVDLQIDAQLCNGRRRRTKSVGMNLSPSRQRISPVPSPTAPPSPPSPPASWLPPSSPPSWTQAGVSWLKMSHVDDLQAAAVSVCTRAGSATPHSNPQDLAVGGCELSLRLNAPRHSGDRSSPQSQKAPWYTPELEPLPLISSRNYRADALQKVGSAQLSRASGMGHGALGRMAIVSLFLVQVFFIWKNTKANERRLVYALKPSPKQPAAYARVPGGAQAAWDACTELVTALSTSGHPFLLPSAHVEPVGYIGQRVFAQPEPEPEPDSEPDPIRNIPPSPPPPPLPPRLRPRSHPHTRPRPRSHPRSRRRSRSEPPSPSHPSTPPPPPSRSSSRFGL